MTARAGIALAGLGSALLLAGALGFQFLGGLAPCPMCIWQRWPHVAAVLVAVAALALWRQARWLAAAGALVMLVSAGLGVFHAGVEQGWWEGLSACAGGGIEGVPVEDLLDFSNQAPPVRCDEIVWQFLGLSMAGWNAVLSLGLAVLWLAAVRRTGA